MDLGDLAGGRQLGERLQVWGVMSLFKLGSGLGLESSDSYENCLGGDLPIGWGR